MTDDDPAVEMELAREALADADGMRHHASDRGTINRLYYACFHAAQAVLYERGFDPQTHDAVKRLFGREIVVGDDATKADGAFLSDMYDMRTDADYEQEPFSVTINTFYNRTERFVEDMSELIDKDGDE